MLPAFIMKIFKFFIKTLNILRLLILNFFFWGIIIFSLVLFINKEEATLESNSILLLNLNGNIVEEKTALSPLTGLAGDYLNRAPKQEMRLRDIIRVIEQAAKDPKIVSIQLDTTKMGNAGFNSLKDISKALDLFKKSKKKIIAIQDNYSQKGYYLAAHADTIIMNPVGFVGVHGLSSYRLYFKRAIDKLFINYNVFLVGDYKSALEPFTRNSMSGRDKEQTRDWLTDLWGIYRNDIIAQRDLSDANMLYNYTHNLPELLAEVGGDSAKLAVQAGLVDKLLQRHQVSPYLKELSYNPENTVDFNQYLATIPPREYSSEKPTIAVAIAEGKILPGLQPAGVIGSESLIRIIKEARDDENIKALVLRINSGGGSAFASELIRQELLAFKAKGKTLIVSMGRLAASGGYWISADADQIWASPATITGSIGIFAAIPTFEKSLAHLGIYCDGVGTSPLAGATNISKPLTEPIKAALQISIKHGYRQFINIVSIGRGIEPEKVEAMAQGHVYSGKKALQLGLVDKLGNLSQAIEAAAIEAGIKDYNLIYLEKELSLQERVLQLFSAGLKSINTMTQISPEMAFFAEEVNKTQEFLKSPDPQGIYAYSGDYPY
ncbi:signal peptide peptidase SppA [Desulfotalea psychrophila]|uniref:Related to proteinase IV n=1 Tax=Desulfotalea psychrophila (strain LSv54 / DSM 12343) TaxID=177439 RepID=Q6AL47_DESPS|nr:signal peptide peptidase SppA [Desulfotalea psychrophila]CAG36928.1 related to proteinase IV [Desulfotalea psychrophila LSv54]